MPDSFPPKRLRRRLDPGRRPGGGAAAGLDRADPPTPATAGPVSDLRGEPGSVESPSTPLALLGDRTFGPFFVGNLVSNAGNWFQNLAAGVVVYELTESNTLVGLVSVLQFTATLLLSPWAGVAGDRYDRKRLLIAAQALSAVGAGALAIAVVALGVEGLGGPLPVFAATMVIGVGYAVSVPMVQAIVPQLVRPADLEGAIALSSITFNLARAIGPALAGWLVAAAGAGAAFGVNAASFVVMIAVLLAIRPRPVPAYEPGADRSLRAGLRWVRGDRVAVPVMIATVAIGWGSDPLNTLSPAVAEQLGRGDGFVGALVSAFGAGAAVSALVVDRVRRRIGHRGATLLGLALLGIGMVGLAATPSPIGALAALAVAGVGFLVGITSLNTALQRRVPEEMRARVMALWSVALLGVRPLAALVDGGLADLTSVSTALVVAGVFPLVTVIALARADLDPAETSDPR